jgi:hypothetical protein
MTTHFFLRHPELVSGSNVQQATPSLVEGWMLKQVQHDGGISKVW